MVADVGVSALVIDGDDAGDLILVGAGLLENGSQQCPAVPLDEDGGDVLVIGLQGHSAADVHGSQDALAAGEDIIHILLAGAIAVACVHGGLEELAAVQHAEIFLPGDVVIPLLLLGRGLGLGGVADELFVTRGLLQQFLGHLDLAGAGGANQDENFGLMVGAFHIGIAGGDDLQELQELVVVVDRQHACGGLVPGTAHEDGVGGVGLEDVVHAIVEEDVHVQLILPGAHVNVLGRDLGEFLHDALGTDAHVFRGNGGGDEDVGHLRQLPHEFLRALDDGLGAVEFGIVEEFEDHIGPGAQLTPAVHLVDGKGRIKLIFLICEPDGIGDAFHQQIVHVQGRGHTKAFTHDRHLIFIIFRQLYAYFRHPSM